MLIFEGLSVTVQLLCCFCQPSRLLLIFRRERNDQTPKDLNRDMWLLKTRQIINVLGNKEQGKLIKTPNLYHVYIHGNIYVKKKRNVRHKRLNRTTSNLICKSERSVSCDLTFISTDSLSFSRLTIFMATFWHVTQWIPSLTNPVKTDKNTC